MSCPPTTNIFFFFITQFLGTMWSKMRALKAKSYYLFFIVRIHAYAYICSYVCNEYNLFTEKGSFQLFYHIQRHSSDKNLQIIG